MKNLYDYFIIKNSGLFDPYFYLGMYPDVRRADMDPLWHYIKFGWREGRNPSINFDTNFYLTNYLDVKNSTMNPLVHYVKFGEKEGRVPISQPQIVGNLNTTSENINIIYDDYDYYRQPWRKKALLDFFSYCVEKKYQYKISHMILLPLFSMGGGELVAMDFIYTIVQENKEAGILLLITDINFVKNNFAIPENVMVLVLDEFLATTDRTKKKLFIYDLINTLRPSVVHNINSDVMWNLTIEKGENLRKVSKLYANIFCFQFDAKWKKIGYAAYYLRKSIPYLDGLLSDNKRFINDAIKEYHLSSYSDKFYTIYTPSQLVEPNDLSSVYKKIDGYPSRRNLNKRIRCVWAGRLDAQKRWDLFLKIVEKATFCDFDMYGQPVLDEEPRIPSLPNLSYFGSFKSSIDLFMQNEYDAFLFTSSHEGMPTILIAAGSCGIPIIAPTVGGVGELVNENTGYPLTEDPSVDEYVAALKMIQNNPQEAAKRAQNMVELIVKQHSWEHFTQDIRNLPGYLV